MNFFDLHCDCIFESIDKKKSLIDGDLCVNLDKISKFKEYRACFAVWIPDDFSFQESIDLFNNAINKFKEYELGKSKILLSVEGGKILGDDISNINLLKKNNVKTLTLTWNGRCNIGDGCHVENSLGITHFGKKVVSELENNNIIIDLSHSSEKLFYDVCEISSKPFICSHSNAKSVHNHVRNISDDQFKIIVKIGGIVGVNFCKDFLSGKNSKIENVFEHIDHFMSLGGENSVCIGSDFDGSETLDEIKDVLDVYKLYEFLLKKNYQEKTINKIFYENANNFFNNL